ncbi:hypothetical protein V8E36_002865 [Tilletia maclaganii]
MQDIRTFFASPSGSASKRRRLDDGSGSSGGDRDRNEQSPPAKKKQEATPQPAAAVHPFFSVKHGRRPTAALPPVTPEASASASSSATAGGGGGGPKYIPLDAPLPTPDSMFTSIPGQPISKMSRSLDLVYYPNFIASPADATGLFSYLLHNLAWHRVKYYKAKFNQSFSTPRWTTTFGRDDGEDPDSTYDQSPVPVPPVLKQVQAQIEARTGERFNAIIVNYYADGNDSISYHSDDESFLGRNPAIASLTLGTPRPFLLRRKANAPPAPTTPSAEELQQQRDRPSVLQAVLPTSSRAIMRPTYRLPLPPGSLLLMRGRTQHEWEHSIPKSTAKKNMGGAGAGGAGAVYGGRMNLTFRRVVKRSGTLNFIQYNRGDGPQYRWDGSKFVEASGGL